MDMSSYFKLIIAIFLIISFVYVLVKLNQNPRLAKFDMCFKFSELELKTTATYEKQKEKVTNVNQHQ